jgi:magnesium-transporting ATPase (P-type)
LENHHSRTAFVKGAPKEVLALCTRIVKNGQEWPLDEGGRVQILAVNDEYARGGLRVLAVAQRILPDRLVRDTSEAAECDLTFLGLIAMMDPPRTEVAEAVEKCHHAGIRIIMITGDYGLTAASIAQRVGIIRGAQLYYFQRVRRSHRVHTAFTYSLRTLALMQSGFRLILTSIKCMAESHSKRGVLL